MRTAPFLKNPAFKEEREYRISMMCNRRSRRYEDDKRPVKPIKFRVGPRGNVVPYIELFADIKTNLPIRAIIVGPHFEQTAQVKAVELLLEQHEYQNVSIRRSEAPFRV